MNPLALTTIKEAAFDWALPLRGVWDEGNDWDVAHLHQVARDDFRDGMNRLAKDSAESRKLGWVIIGEGGSGKTHLAGAFRRIAMANKAYFVLVDMTDVRDFWETVLQGYIDSLQQTHTKAMPQYEVVMRRFIEKKLGRLGGKAVWRRLQKFPIKTADEFLKKVWEHNRSIGPYQQDALRCLLYMNSGDYLSSNIAISWLQGQPVEAEIKKEHHFWVDEPRPLEVAAALSWVMGQSAPTALVIDQLDPIVMQLSLTGNEPEGDPSHTAEGLLLEIGNGMVSLQKNLTRTWSILTCLEESWEEIVKLPLTTIADRFDQPPTRLRKTESETVVTAMIANRMATAAKSTGYHLPYPSWPFAPEAIRRLVGETPRQVFKICEAHRKRCLESGTAFEVENLEPFISHIEIEPIAFDTRIDEIFSKLVNAIDVDDLLDEEHEDSRLAPLVEFAATCLLHENESKIPPDVTLLVDAALPTGAVRPLHARLRAIFEKENEREEHFCVRVLQKTHARAFQARIKAAMTASGIDEALPFRHLRLLRTTPLPGGLATEELYDNFTQAGGKIIAPDESELARLAALYELKQMEGDAFHEWLMARRPVSRLSFTKALFPCDWLWGGIYVSPPRLKAEPAPVSVETRNEPAPTSSNGYLNGSHGDSNGGGHRPPNRLGAKKGDTAPIPVPIPSGTDRMPLGRVMRGDELGDKLALPLMELERHAVVLAGAGSGKTVLVKRLIEEAALAGIPAVVMDCGNDLAALDQPWPVPPASWEDEDRKKAEKFHADTEVVLWTPGQEAGNPLHLSPIPDFSAFQDDADELHSAQLMAAASLEPIAAPGTGEEEEAKKGLLAKALGYFASSGGDDLDAFIALLESLPGEARTGANDEDRLAAEMAEALKTAVRTNPLMSTDSEPLDPAVLFGDHREDGPTRISVISLIGLPDPVQQQEFLNQLAMNLFSWVKKNPSPPDGRGIRGLLVIDETKEFSPIHRDTLCKRSLQALTAQARKYHLGLIFATQFAREMDNTIVGNCSTHFYGKANSPAAIDAIRFQMRLKGGTGDDIARLPRGQFYVYNAELGVRAPVKFYCPLCLSEHLDEPVAEGTILKKAQSSVVTG